MLSKEEKRELKKLAKSSKLKEDMQKLESYRHNPFMVQDKINIDRFLTFLNEYNKFINHHPKPFRKIIDKDMRL